MFGAHPWAGAGGFWGRRRGGRPACRPPFPPAAAGGRGPGFGTAGKVWRPPQASRRRCRFATLLWFGGGRPRVSELASQERGREMILREAEIRACMQAKLSGGRSRRCSKPKLGPTGRTRGRETCRGRARRSLHERRRFERPRLVRHAVAQRNRRNDLGNELDGGRSRNRRGFLRPERVRRRNKAGTMRRAMNSRCRQRRSG